MAEGEIVEVTKGWDEMEVEGKKIGKEVVWVTNCRGIADRLRDQNQNASWNQRVMEGMIEQMNKDGRGGNLCNGTDSSNGRRGRHNGQGHMGHGGMG